MRHHTEAFRKQAKDDEDDRKEIEAVLQRVDVAFAHAVHVLAADLAGSQRHFANGEQPGKVPLEQLDLHVAQKVG